MLKRINKEHKLYDWFRQNEQLLVLKLLQMWEMTHTLGY